MSVTLTDINTAFDQIAGHIVRTPCTRSETLSAQLGLDLFIKFENQQFTASFKERGALNCLLANSGHSGVIAMSAGNHAQALAYHGRRLNRPTTIVMPRTTPNAKVESTRVFGAEVILHGDHFDETRVHTLKLAQARGLHLIHPFDDPLVIAGQGTVGLEILQQVDDLDVLVVPVGGGGLMAGAGVAIKSLAPQVKLVGVQMSRFAGAHAAFHQRVEAGQDIASTVAEGIAVKTPGEHTVELMRQYVDDFQLVDEADVEQAIFDLLEIEKTVAEGAGAAPLALLRRHADQYRGKRVCMILSGGNIDMMILSSVLQRGLVRSNRLCRLQVEIPDYPGALAELTGLLGKLDSNIVEINHQRAFGGSSVRATLVELVLQLRGEEQLQQVTGNLAKANYDVLVLE